jgi:uncharacterized membrane protein
VTPHHVPWTYWAAYPLVVGSVVYLIGFLYVYVRKVVMPRYGRYQAAR